VAVFVPDSPGKALMPCSEKRARLLLARGRARVHRVMPFVIRLVDRHVQSSTLQPLRIKLDPCGNSCRPCNTISRWRRLPKDSSPVTNGWARDRRELADVQATLPRLHLPGAGGRSG
jgi:hypothetical protein